MGTHKLSASLALLRGCYKLSEVSYRPPNSYFLGCLIWGGVTFCFCSRGIG